MHSNEIIHQGSIGDQMREIRITRLLNYFRRIKSKATHFWVIEMFR